MLLERHQETLAVNFQPFEQRNCSGFAHQHALYPMCALAPCLSPCLLKKKNPPEVACVNWYTPQQSVVSSPGCGIITRERQIGKHRVNKLHPLHALPNSTLLAAHGRLARIKK